MACTPQDIATLGQCISAGMSRQQDLASWTLLTCEAGPTPPTDEGITTDPDGEIITDEDGNIITPDGL